jgi:hypothetical protein
VQDVPIAEFLLSPEVIIEKNKEWGSGDKEKSQVRLALFLLHVIPTANEFAL